MNTIWHYHGGCLVGKVVDRNFRVLGIESLRVVDGSVFTISPGTNPQATLLMLGRSVVTFCNVVVIFHCCGMNVC